MAWISSVFSDDYMAWNSLLVIPLKPQECSQAVSKLYHMSVKDDKQATLWVHGYT